MLVVRAWRLYQVCETGELPHVRINNLDPHPARDLEQLLAGSVTIAEGRRSHRRKPRSE